MAFCWWRHFFLKTGLFNYRWPWFVSQFFSCFTNGNSFHCLWVSADSGRYCTKDLIFFDHHDLSFSFNILFSFLFVASASFFCIPLTPSCFWYFYSHVISSSTMRKSRKVFAIMIVRTLVCPKSFAGFRNIARCSSKLGNWNYFLKMRYMCLIDSEMRI